MSQRIKIFLRDIMCINVSTPGLQKSSVLSRQQQYTSKLRSSSRSALANTIGKRKNPFTNRSCVICLQTDVDQTLDYAGKCDHYVCKPCFEAYLNNVAKDDRYVTIEEIECPATNCQDTHNTEALLSELKYSPHKKAEWWKSAIMRTHISNKVTCPFRECRAIFDAETRLIEECTFGECMECNKGFCIACQEQWHPGVIKISKDVEQLKKTLATAKMNNWTHCPHCNFLVSKREGCLIVLCRCRREFCYRCGGNAINHNCSSFCNNFSAQKLAEARNTMFAGQEARLRNGTA